MVRMMKLNADTIVGLALITIALWLSLDAFVTSRRGNRRTRDYCTAALEVVSARLDALEAPADVQTPPSPFGPVQAGLVAAHDAQAAGLAEFRRLSDAVQQSIDAATRHLRPAPEPPQTIPLPLSPEGDPAPDPTEPRNMDRERLGVLLDQMVRDGMTPANAAHALGLSERRAKAVLLQHWTRMAGLPAGGYELDLIPGGM